MALSVIASRARSNDASRPTQASSPRAVINPSGLPALGARHNERVDAVSCEGFERLDLLAQRDHLGAGTVEIAAEPGGLEQHEHEDDRRGQRQDDQRGADG